MEVVHGHRSAPAWPGAALAIGNFDGVHAGHRALIDRARALAAARGLAAVALTFDPHPAAVLAPQPPARVCSLARRLELLAAAGLDATVVEPFTRELAALTADAFVDDIVLGALRARAIVVGYDFCYGHGRTGSTDALRAHGARAGADVEIVPPVQVDDEIASSSKIRNYLRAGDLPGAERLLGRRWDLDGTVVHGAKRGRAIGIPTANIAPESDLSIAPGIYAVTLAVLGEGGPAAALPAVASLGTNPTFVESGGLVLEVHVLGWDGDLYGRRVRTTFVAKIRDEQKFDSVDALLAQIRTDIDRARSLLG
ncbi:MAG TPA: bifunctional riboflavin kinase/FAD synthetase [Kofleriaceae bacterium]|nr:bifunctional riboflavin kinase/FAD synthetase [Kofleriaceae bacterium]